MIWSIDYDSPTSVKNPHDPIEDGNDETGDTCSGCEFEPAKSSSWKTWHPQDLSAIKKLAAIGDSYSAGIGAGHRMGSIFDSITLGTG